MISIAVYSRSINIEWRHITHLHRIGCRRRRWRV